MILKEWKKGLFYKISEALSPQSEFFNKLRISGLRFSQYGLQYIRLWNELLLLSLFSRTY